jgi:hypothetical protein
MNVPNPHTGEIECPHCHKSGPVQAFLPIEPMWDGRELREIVGWSRDRWTSYWSPRFPAYFQYKHIRGSVRPQLIRVFPSSQVRAFMDSGVWLRPLQKKTRRAK